MIPIRHTQPPHGAPIITRTLVAANVAIFVLQIYVTTATAERIIQTFGFIPSRLFNPVAWGYVPWEVAITLVSSLFLHGGFVHLFGNMIYLWTFGDAVEDTFGHTKYLLFFVACGVAGSLIHTLVFPRSVIPSIGASGSAVSAGVVSAAVLQRRRVTGRGARNGGGGRRGVVGARRGVCVRGGGGGGRTRTRETRYFVAARRCVRCIALMTVLPASITGSAYTPGPRPSTERALSIAERSATS